MNKLLRIIPTGVTSLVILLAIIYLSLASDPLGAKGMHLFKYSDKVAHFVMYFALSYAFIIDYAKLRMPHHTRLNVELALMCTAALVGLLLEVAQLVLSTERSYEVSDIVVNAIGAAAGFVWLRYAGGMHRFRSVTLRRGHHRRRH